MAADNRVTADAIVSAGEPNRLALEQPLDDGDGLCQPLDACHAGIERESRLLVLRTHVPGADTEFQPSAAQHIQRRRLARRQHRMAEVVIQDTGAEPQARRRGCGRD